MWLFLSFSLFFDNYFQQSVIYYPEFPKFVIVKVKNALDEEEVQKCIKTFSESMLCKTVWFECDANCGRIIMSIGRSGINISSEKVDVFL